MSPVSIDVLDHDDVSTCDGIVEILREPHATAASAEGSELDRVEPVVDRHRSREVGEKDDARLEWRDQKRLATLVLGCERAPSSANPGGDLGAA